MFYTILIIALLFLVPLYLFKNFNFFPRFFNKVRNEKANPTIAIDKNEINIIVRDHVRNKYVTETDPLTHEKHPINLPEFKIKLKGLNKDKFYYGLRIITGDQLRAGTGYINFQLTGLKGLSVRLTLGNFLDPIQKQQYDDILIESDKDLGEIQIIDLGNEGKWLELKAEWFVEFCTVFYLTHDDSQRKIQNFPCYSWISAGEHFELISREALRKDVEHNPILCNQRDAQIEERRRAYKWSFAANLGVPSGIDTRDEGSLPKGERFDASKDIHFSGNKNIGIRFVLYNTVKHNITNVLKITCNDDGSFHELHEYYSLAVKLSNQQIEESPEMKVGSDDKRILIYEGDRWMTDMEFGRQVLNGVNPVVIKRCNELPAYFPVTNDMVKGFINSDTTLDQEIQAGRVYIGDMSYEFDGLPCLEGSACSAPICLLYTNDQGHLMPIAIQLRREPGENSPIFLPSDNHFDWLLAKIHYQSASHQFHQLSTHFLACHAVVETYAVGTMRNLPISHPIYKLLKPHFRYTLAVNHAAKKKLINDGGIIDLIFSIGGGPGEGNQQNSGKNQLIRKAAEKFRVQSTNIKRNIVDRGVENPDLLPGYHYRDDGLKIWNAIESYAEDIINLFYRTDEEVGKDLELKNWANDLHCNGFVSYKTAPLGRGFPKQILTKMELVEYTTLIMFTASAQHSAVNFTQFETYGFLPNAPAGLRKPAPEKKGVADHNYLMKSLPEIIKASLSIATTWALSRYSPDEVFLGACGTHWFTNEKAKHCLKKYHDNLNKITEEIVERNKKLYVPYVALLPGRIANSITI